MDERILIMAEAMAQSAVEHGVRAVTNRIPVQPDGFDGHCVVCEVEIPLARIKFGAVTCISCQEKIELREKQGR